MFSWVISLKTQSFEWTLLSLVPFAEVGEVTSSSYLPFLPLEKFVFCKLVGAAHWAVTLWGWQVGSAPWLLCCRHFTLFWFHEGLTWFASLLTGGPSPNLFCFSFFFPKAVTVINKVLVLWGLESPDYNGFAGHGHGDLDFFTYKPFLPEIFILKL